MEICRGIQLIKILPLGQSKFATAVKRFTMNHTNLSMASLNIAPIQKSVEENYENAIKLLNRLQSNAQTLAQIKKRNSLLVSPNIPRTIGALKTMGISLDDVDKLNIIHVTGTKGKGMTCAFTESILRQTGLKTGFFSSPHLTAVRERIRINGKPLTADEFAQSFFTVYNKLKQLQEPNSLYEMPHYFSFLTCMAFHVFIQEKVDVAVLEVGIGGLHDSTNVIRKPIVVGISSIALEHQSVLGQTLEEIAFQKSGIMKRNVPAYSVESQPPEVLQVLRSSAEETECPLYCIPDSLVSNMATSLGVNDEYVARLNAGLAVHLANEFLLKKQPSILSSSHEPVNFAHELQCSNPNQFPLYVTKGLESTKWDGRFQIHKISDKLQYYIDGAHTIESLNVALNWFANTACPSSYKILIFNLTGERSSRSHLEPFAKTDLFDLVVFCPFIASRKNRNADNWSSLDDEKDVTLECQKLAAIWESFGSSSQSIVFDSAENTIAHIEGLLSTIVNNNDNQFQSISVLITGSLHLAGSFLTVLEPNRND